MNEIEDLMRRTDPASAVVDEKRLAALFAAEPYRTPEPARQPGRGLLIAKWAGAALAAAAVIAGILAVPLIVSSPIPPSGDYPWYATQSELEDAASAVVVVEVVAERPGTYQDLLHDVMTVIVVADARGGHEIGSTMEIKEMPGEDALRVGDRFVVFIVEYEDGIPASLVNPTQGAYLVQDGSVIPRDGNGVVLDGALLRELGLTP
jgi:hypothetical protein